ncbi:nuclear transport factor 2 family protein [Sphingomonas radiodurans]|uniref:nuclear transport factor 2 family protein n=1 Tax=Sphingomonas radiodurans TaxID=2890321 RepID=UPI001E369ADF|nr:nuclear transport factor 2 family protein [Sphingomonas radiodurans]WBH16841.1 nuclear transport factor 2 family protein [Sphingomonas radiodurans]
MEIELPDPIARYFAADQVSDAAAVASCFTDDAVVKDEGNAYVGKDAIRQWKAEASSTYNYTVEPFALVAEGDRTVVTSHVVGDFPGSPVDLRYFFGLNAGKIAALEIIP